MISKATAICDIKKRESEHQEELRDEHSEKEDTENCNNEDEKERDTDSGSETEEDIDDPCVARILTNPTSPLLDGTHVVQKEKTKSLNELRQETPRLNGLPMKRPCIIVTPRTNSSLSLMLNKKDSKSPSPNKGSPSKNQINTYITCTPTNPTLNEEHTLQKEKSKSLDETSRCVPKLGGLPVKRSCSIVTTTPLASPSSAIHNRKIPQCLLPKEELEKMEAEKSPKVRDLKSQFIEKAIEFQEGAPDAKIRPLIDIQWEELPKSGRVVCFDVETTGFSAEDEIVEIGGVELVDGIRTGAVFHSYARPRHKIHIGASAVHGLTEEILKDELPSDFVVASFIDWVGSSALIAHNALFDIRMISQCVRKGGLAGEFHVTGAYCSMRYFRKMFPGYPSKLDDVATFLRVNNKYQRARILHGALVDAELLAACYQKLITLNKDEIISGMINVG